MRFFILASIFLFFQPLNARGKTEEQIKDTLLRGGVQYAKCYFCHSLKPGVHLTGPSLANLWDAPAGAVKDFELYTDDLQKKGRSGFKWNEKNLVAWLKDPTAQVPGTTMKYKFEGDQESIESLVEFLKIAMGPDGYDVVLKQKLTSPDFANGQAPYSARKVESKDFIERIEVCKSVAKIYRKNKSMTKHWIENINFKVSQSSEVKDVRLVATGSLGDRFMVLFPNLETLTKTVRPCVAESDTRPVQKN